MGRSRVGSHIIWVGWEVKEHGQGYTITVTIIIVTATIIRVGCKVKKRNQEKLQWHLLVIFVRHCPCSMSTYHF